MIGSIYLFLNAFNPAFAFHEWVPITLIISFILFLVVILKKEIILDKFTFFYFVFVILFLTSTLVNFIHNVDMNMNHFYSIILISFLYFLVPVWCFSKWSLPSLSRPIIVSFILICIYGMVDFIVINIFHFSITESVIYFPDSYNVGYGYFGGMFFRNKSIFQEPGFYAWYLNVMAPLCIYLSWDKFKLKTIVFSFYFFSIVTTFSATGIMGLLIISFFLLVNIKSKILKLVCLVVGITSTFFLLGNVLYEIINNKVLSDSNSKLERFSRWSDGFDLFINNIFFGGGIGSYSRLHEVGLASFPLKILAETGVFTFLIFVSLFLFLAFRIYNYFKIERSILILFASLFANFLHWSTSTPFYMAFPWLGLALLYVLTQKSRINFA
ncbi:O-antigen ligase family protein [Pseudoalteromonas distincta]|uniref:O-antigen ligase family protein n=1 Tax=Pseudoalteromonas distincta TaxID=77608 RepID=UPI003218D06B